MNCGWLFWSCRATHSFVSTGKHVANTIVRGVRGSAEGELLSQRIPENWRSLNGPANWFRLWYPPDWTVAEVDEKVMLSSPDGSALLTIHSAWSREAESRPLENLIPLETFIGNISDSRRTTPLAGQADSLGFEGTTRLETRPVWWKRAFTRPSLRPWRLWGLRAGPVLVVATLLHTGDRDRELESRTGYILRTLEFPAMPADPPDEFAQRVIQLARRKFPLLDCELTQDFQLRLGQSQVNLFNFYRSYVQAPDKFEQMMLPALTTVVQVQEWGQQQSDPPLESVRDRIMPMLYPEETWREHFPSFVGVPWVGGLMILYVVDESRAYWYIRDTLPKSWGINEEQLHEIALENLDGYFQRKPMQLAVAGGEGDPLMVMPTQPDSYNAVRLLSEPFRQKVREVVGGSFAVGIPNRDFFIVIGLESDDMLTQIREKVRGDHTEMDHPLTNELLLVTPDGVSAFPDGEV